VLEFEQNKPPKLTANYNPPGTIWLAIGATIATGIVVTVIAQVVGCMAGPGLIIWYWIISASRRKKVEISLADSEQVICDDKKRGIAIFGLIENQKAWFSIKCPNDYEKIVYLLTETNVISPERRELQTAQLAMIIVLLVLLVLVALVWFLAIQSFKN
jgi:glycerol uptake facilitator-like aquaporin